MSSSADGLVDYTTGLTHNLRWSRFAFRDDDIVIAAPGKSGTTWTQLIVGLLLFDGEEPETSIAEMSPWLDMTLRSEEYVFDLLERQTHRRFIKTHTPLDGVVIDERVRYVCVARDPRDAAISFVHHFNNLDYDRLADATAQMGGTYEPDGVPDGGFPTDMLIRPWVTPEVEEPWPLDGLVHQIRTYWERRQRPNVELFHFADYQRDLPAEIERMAAFLDVPLEPGRAAELAAEAGIESARRRADRLAPDAQVGSWKDAEHFFRSGESGQWADVLDDAEQARYEERIAGLAEPELARWMHDGWGGP